MIVVNSVSASQPAARQKNLRFSDKLDTIEMDSLEADMEYDFSDESLYSNNPSVTKVFLLILRSLTLQRN